MHYKPIINEAFKTFTWVDPMSNASYMICDQQWHNLEIKHHGSLVSITIDSHTTNISVQKSGTIIGDLYIGGVPSEYQK